MKFSFSFFLILFLELITLLVKFLIYSYRRLGMVVKLETQETEAISSSSFLPVGIKLSVRPKSGLKHLPQGFFRFGSSTTFLAKRSY